LKLNFKISFSRFFGGELGSLLAYQGGVEEEVSSCTVSGPGDVLGGGRKENIVGSMCQLPAIPTFHAARLARFAAPRNLGETGEFHSSRFVIYASVLRYDYDTALLTSSVLSALPVFTYAEVGHHALSTIGLPTASLPFHLLPPPPAWYSPAIHIRVEKYQAELKFVQMFNQGSWLWGTVSQTT